MQEHVEGLMVETISGPTEAIKMIGRLFDVARTDAVFSKPEIVGEYVVITASEQLVAMGAGYGGGAGFDTNEAEKDAPETGDGGFGGGGGGGGYSMSRPVAAITIGPGGTRVDPIIDPTKIAIAFFTTFAAMAITILQVERFRRLRNHI